MASYSLVSHGVGSSMAINFDNVNYIMKEFKPDPANIDFVTLEKIQGKDYVSSTLQDRVISIDFYVFADSEMSMLGKKRRIQSVCSPLTELTLYKDNYYIQCRASSSIKWSSAYKENNSQVSRGIITLRALDPYWHDGEGTVLNENSAISGLHFPHVVHTYANRVPIAIKPMALTMSLIGPLYNLQYSISSENSREDFIIEFDSSVDFTKFSIVQPVPGAPATMGRIEFAKSGVVYEPGHYVFESKSLTFLNRTTGEDYTYTLDLDTYLQLILGLSGQLKIQFTYRTPSLVNYISNLEFKVNNSYLEV